ncbi:hypothetical protein CXB51_016120 [Gossypium anomalum]|uniref:Uncharacterized protein n=1 Tax=Gossypium anomalum TaxID=47600 RepID=A0A8J6D0G5_9ROSI|nr:hypothetical protein CXB51_016120 [Gossypium anomalum]
MALQRRSMMSLDPSNFDFQRRGQRSMTDLQDLIYVYCMCMRRVCVMYPSLCRIIRMEERREARVKETVLGNSSWDPTPWHCSGMFQKLLVLGCWDSF